MDTPSWGQRRRTGAPRPADCTPPGEEITAIITHVLSPHQAPGQVPAPPVHCVRLVLLSPGHLPHHVRTLPAGIPPVRDHDQGGHAECQGEQEDPTHLHPQISPDDHLDRGR